MDTASISLAIFLALNVSAFLLMWWDKARSREWGAERISEGLLFFLAACFGSVGVYLGMFCFRHKTRVWYFLIGIPLMLAQNIATLILLRTFLGGA